MIINHNLGIAAGAARSVIMSCHDILDAPSWLFIHSFVVAMDSCSTS